TARVRAPLAPDEPTVSAARDGGLSPGISYDCRRMTRASLLPAYPANDRGALLRCTVLGGWLMKCRGRTAISFGSGFFYRDRPTYRRRHAKRELGVRKQGPDASRPVCVVSVERRGRRVAPAEWTCQEEQCALLAHARGTS